MLVIKINSCCAGRQIIRTINISQGGVFDCSEDVQMGIPPLGAWRPTALHFVHNALMRLMRASTLTLTIKRTTTNNTVSVNVAILGRGIPKGIWEILQAIYFTLLYARLY